MASEGLISLIVRAVRQGRGQRDHEANDRSKVDAAASRAGCCNDDVPLRITETFAPARGQVVYSATVRCRSRLDQNWGNSRPAGPRGVSVRATSILAWRVIA